MPGGVHESSAAAAAPPGRCCCACARPSAKRLLHFAIVSLLFVFIFKGFEEFSIARVVLQSMSYAAIAGLYTFTSSSRRESILSGAFLALLAAVIILTAVSAKRSRATVIVMSLCNLLALTAYCVRKLRRARGADAAAAADAEAPLAPPVMKEDDGGSTPVQQTTMFHIEDLPRKFSYDEIRTVTGDFGTVVGRGGSAEVFRGLLDDGMAVAVKRITSNVGEVGFLGEISIVASVHHRSLVRLLGYCLLRGGGGSQYLVYPFFENGSLDWWLFNGEERRRLLPWPTRRRITIDVARALAYLHHECRHQILHLDIKPANILLDGGLRAHVSDFGISMSIGQDLTSVSTRGRGTRGYMAPEMLVSSMSAKSDVYSYGMTLLELVGGRRSVEPGSGSSKAPDFFARVVRERMARGELMEVVDAAMAHVHEREMETVVKVALCCVQHRRDSRPSMLSVLDMIEGRVAVDVPPESRLSVTDLMEPLSSAVQDR
ncbi:hypothetical protein BS78_03G212100 [Paspalum vaginatum]|nr:hypothetical protein BS78_03G212100 [Paspalum vaginatum]